MLSTVDQFCDLALALVHDRCRVAVAHIFKIDQIERFPVFCFQLFKRIIKLAVSLAAKQISIDQGVALRLEVQLIQAQEDKTVFLIMPKGKVASGFVKICLKAALAPDKPFLRKKLCESFDHQILRLVNVLYVSVYV